MTVQVTVYTAPGCMPCRMTKHHLGQRGIAFNELPVDDASIQESITELGLRTAPVVVASTPNGDVYWDGYRPDRIDDLAAQSRRETFRAV